MRELKATNRGLVNLAVSIDEDRPTIFRQCTPLRKSSNRTVQVTCLMTTRCSQYCLIDHLWIIKRQS
jgi:hypothetical protein